MRKKKLSTVRVKEATTSVRMLPSDRQLLISSASAEGISLGEFIRRAVRQRSAALSDRAQEPTPAAS
jgi:uncharacterized protein (DUF1778 family)